MVLKKILLLYFYISILFVQLTLAEENKSFIHSCNYPIPENWQYQTGQSYFGRNNYIEYIPGDMPLIITAPHGGYLEPSEIPPMANTLERDGGSQEYARLVVDKIFNLTGKRPHIIINHLTRHRLNANSTKDIATGGNYYSGIAWDEFHAYIEDAKKYIQSRCLRGLLLDFHTNGHSEGWVELGYGLSGSTLDLSSSSLNKSTYIDRSTVRSLSLQPNQNFIEVLRGSSSLGGVLSTKGVKVVPSPEFPGPDGGGYFDGGYNVRTHGSIKGGAIDAIQIESHYNYVNSGSTKRNIYSQQLAESILTYLEIQYKKPIKILSRINQGTDDAEELRQSSIGKMNLTSTNLDIVTDSNNYKQLIGLRFNNLNLPANAIIENAYIQFRTSVKTSTTTNLVIKLENTKSPLTYSSLSSNISNRTYTDLSVNWIPVSWSTGGEMSLKQQTPNLKNLIQDLLLKEENRLGLINSLAFSISGSGRRVASSFEGYPSLAPELVIQYTIP